MLVSIPLDNVSAVPNGPGSNPNCLNHSTHHRVSARNVPLKLRQLLVQHLVDQRQRRPHPHRRPVRLVHPRVPGEHSHPRPDRRLPQVDRRDLPLLQFPQRLGKLLPQRGDQPPSVGEPRVSRSRPTGQHDRRRERVGLDVPRVRPPRSVRMGHVAVTAQPAVSMPSSSVSQPVDAWPPSSSVSACLNA